MKTVSLKAWQKREGGPSFVFLKRPPGQWYAGIHHVMARSIKDIFCRYKTMKGFQVKRKAGWDTHDYRWNWEWERLGITKEDIGKKITVAEYNAVCRKDVMKFTKEWEDLTHKDGVLVDMNDPYIRMTTATLKPWWLLKQLYKKDLFIKDIPFSPIRLPEQGWARTSWINRVATVMWKIRR